MPSDASTIVPAPVVRGRRRAALFFAALVVIGLGCVVFALAGIADSQPRGFDYGSGQLPKLAASGPDAAAQLTQGPAPTDPTGPVATDGPAEAAQTRPATGVRFGFLVIPTLNQTLPIVEGTEDAQLERGVGHFEGSTMPGGSNNCVLSGHRDTVFTDLDKVGVGDQLIAVTPAGEFTYLVRQVRIVDKDDKTVIVPTDHAVLTVTTCYPFRYVGAAPKRYVLVADLVARK
jgi:sortase A